MNNCNKLGNQAIKAPVGRLCHFKNIWGLGEGLGAWAPGSLPQISLPSYSFSLAARASAMTFSARCGGTSS